MRFSQPRLGHVKFQQKQAAAVEVILREPTQTRYQRNRPKKASTALPLETT